MKVSALAVVVCLLGLAACGGSSSSGPGVVADPQPDGDNSGNPPSTGGEFVAPTSAPTVSQIRPGVEITADGSACTANFIFSLNSSTVYIGVAAHCFSPDANDEGGCEAENLPNGYAQVGIENASKPGELVYSSWRAMQEVGEDLSSAACEFNDFALVKIHADDLANVHPAVLEFGGPTALFESIAETGEAVYAYGASFGAETKSGQVSAIEGGGWAYRLQMGFTPGVPGDSGGPVLASGGQALGVTTLLNVSLGLGAPISNSAVNLHRALSYARDNGFINQGVRLETWQEFNSAGGL